MCAVRRPVCATQLEVAKDITADKFEYIHAEAAKRIKKDSYMDDGASGSNSRKDLDDLAEGIESILAGGGFKVKGMVRSGDPESKVVQLWGSQEQARVFGVHWDPQKDKFSFTVVISLTKKFKGARTSEVLTMEIMPAILETVLTRRIVLGVINTCHDPLGLLVPITVQLKIQMRDLFSKELNLDWDTALPHDIKVEWIRLFQLLKQVEGLTFKRTVRPEQAVGNPELVLYWDASDEAMCAAAYMLWQTKGEPECNLLCAKSRVAPLNRISTPRAEMQSAVLSVRLRKSYHKAHRHGVRMDLPHRQL